MTFFQKTKPETTFFVQQCGIGCFFDKIRKKVRQNSKKNVIFPLYRRFFWMYPTSNPIGTLSLS